MTADLAPRTRLAAPGFADAPVAIDDRARWLVTGQTAPIDPYGPAHEPLDLGTPRWLWLAPDGNLLITLETSGRITRRPLDATRALHAQLVCR